MPALAGVRLQPAFELKVDGPLDRLGVDLHVRSSAGEADGKVVADLVAPGESVNGVLSVRHLDLAPIVNNRADKSDLTAELADRSAREGFLRPQLAARLGHAGRAARRVRGIRRRAGEGRCARQRPARGCERPRRRVRSHGDRQRTRDAAAGQGHGPRRPGVRPARARAARRPAPAAGERERAAGGDERDRRLSRHRQRTVGDRRPICGSSRRPWPARRSREAAPPASASKARTSAIAPTRRSRISIWSALAASSRSRRSPTIGTRA